MFLATPLPEIAEDCLQRAHEIEVYFVGDQLDHRRGLVPCGKRFYRRATEGAGAGSGIQNPKLATGDLDLRRHEVGGRHGRQVETMLLAVRLGPGGDVVLADAVRVLRRPLTRCWRGDETDCRRRTAWLHDHAWIVATALACARKGLERGWRLARRFRRAGEGAGAPSVLRRADAEPHCCYCLANTQTSGTFSLATSGAFSAAIDVTMSSRPGSRGEGSQGAGGK